jgi:multidrug resistance efflux pump
MEIMNHKLYLSIIAIITMFCLLLSGCNASKAKHVIKLSGKIETPLTAITAPRAGKVLGLILEKGDRIRKGEPLFAIAKKGDDEGINKATTELARAEAQLKNAKSGASAAQMAAAQGAVESASISVTQAQQLYQKMSNLYKIGGIAKKKLDQSQENLAEAEANYSATQAHLRQLSTKASPESVAGLEEKVKNLKAAYDKEIQNQSANETKAPSTCTVTDVLLKNGEEAAEGQNVMNVRSLTDCSIKASAKGLPSTAALKEGLKVQIKSKNSPRSFEGTISEVKDGIVTITSTTKPEDLQEGTDVDISIEVS